MPWTKNDDYTLKKLNNSLENTRNKIYDNWNPHTSWSYWNATIIIPKFLFLGDRSSANDVDNLKKTNITYILNCAGKKCTEFTEYDDTFTIHVIEAIDNMKCEILKKYLIESIEFIEKAKKNKKRILVHCVGGVNRSATIVAAYLMYSKYKKDIFEAANYIVSKRTSCLRNNSFKRQLIQYNNYLQSQRNQKKKRD